VGAAQSAATGDICVAIQRGLGNGFGNVADAEIRPGSSFQGGANPTMLLQTTPGDIVQPSPTQDLLRFDVSAIGSHAHLTSAVITLIETSFKGGTGTVLAFDVTTPWNEATVTGLSFGNAVSGNIGTGVSSRFVTHIDILAEAQGWVDGSIPNNGLLLEQATTGARTFNTSEAASAGARPTLEVCYTNLCVGVVCQPSDQCHVAGTCDPTTGLCSNPAASDGTTCDDGDLCTTGDVCTGGACGGSPVVCTPSDQCHTAGTCNPLTGQCTDPVAPNGTPCDDGNPCTQNDTCESTSGGKTGAIIITGHDPDFHAQGGGGPASFLLKSFAFVRQGKTGKFLFVQGFPGCTATDNACAPPGNLNPKFTLTLLGFTEGVDYDQVGAAEIPTVDFSLYDFIFVTSDFGGLLRQAELDALVARSSEIIAYLDNGGGLLALAESGTAGLTTDPSTFFKFLPFVVSAVQKNQVETGITVTPFGASLGFVDSDVDQAFSHNVFASTGGMNVIDVDQSGAIVSLAFQGIINSSGATTTCVGTPIVTPPCGP
jgi:hypothetical protein